MFYQYNPNGAFHGTIHWGHAASDDLVHWEHLPIALAPTPDGPDADGCWTGSAVDGDGVPTLIYSGVFPQTVCVARGSTDLVTWEKYAGNPVIEAPPPGIRDAAAGHFRDPYVWREDDVWHMVIGSRIEGAGGVALLYRSYDLINWTYVHPFLVGDIGEAPFWTGTMWECPNFLDLGDRQALLVSLQGTPMKDDYTVYHTGAYENRTFSSDVQGILVHGGSFYAPQAMRLDDGRYVLWGWLKEGRARHISQRSGWAGVMSLPLTVSLLPDGRLGLQPVKELGALRRKHRRWDRVELNRGSVKVLRGVRGDSLELEAEVTFAPGAVFGLRLRCSPDGQEQTRIVYRAAEGRLVIERDASSVSPHVERDERSAPVELAPGEPLKLHVFLDHSVIEVVVNDGRTCLASRIYPFRPDSLGLGLFARKGSATVESIDVWELDAIWG